MHWLGDAGELDAPVNAVAWCELFVKHDPWLSPGNLNVRARRQRAPQITFQTKPDKGIRWKVPNWLERVLDGMLSSTQS